MSKPYSQPGEKGTDTNQASELFELCKEVYRRHQFWAGTDMIFGKEVGRDWRIMPLTLRIPKHNRIPLYTSDYLLEKLLPITSIQLKRKASGDIRLFYFPEKPDYATYDYDTPLKCLLALTIALSEAGELK